MFTLAFGAVPAAAAGSILTLVALLLLYGFGLMVRTPPKEAAAMKEETHTPLKTKIEQLLTEARVIIPGGQALLGFQFAAMLTNAFAELPHGLQLWHAAGLCSVALAVTLLMTPAALHRLAFGGENSPQFFRLASPIVVLASIPLAAGIAADIGVVFWKVTQSASAAAASGLVAAAVLLGLWIGYPLARRTAVSG